MKQKISIILIIVGILLIFYPIIGKIVSKLNQTNAIEKYKEQVIDMSDDEIEELKENYRRNKVDNIEDMLGYIEIEKIGVFLPIYEGTTDKVLLKGIGHLENTDLPLSDGAYHSVLVGHTGISAKTFFDNLIDLNVGDCFSVTILNETYNYQIYDIRTVLPTETDFLKEDDGQLVTLVTCTPKYINSHRLFVTGRLME